jgi:hypothetical protein
MLKEKISFHFCNKKRLGNTNSGKNEKEAPIRSLKLPPLL